MLTMLGGVPLTRALTHRCCGSFLSAARADVVTPLVNEILARAVAVGAECVVTSCAMCQLNLEIRCTWEPRLPIFHFSEILALALGAEDYEGWFSRHLVDPRPLLAAREIDRLEFSPGASAPHAPARATAPVGATCVPEAKFGRMMGAAAQPGCEDRGGGDGNAEAAAGPELLRPPGPPLPPGVENAGNFGEDAFGLVLFGQELLALLDALFGVGVLGKLGIILREGLIAVNGGLVAFGLIIELGHIKFVFRQILVGSGPDSNPPW